MPMHASTRASTAKPEISTELARRSAKVWAANDAIGIAWNTAKSGSTLHTVSSATFTITAGSVSVRSVNAMIEDGC